MEVPDYLTPAYEASVTKACPFSCLSSAGEASWPNSRPRANSTAGADA